jgi:hypothetical protein
LLLQPDRKRVKRLRQELSTLFMHLEPSAMSNKVDVRRPFTISHGTGESCIVLGVEGRGSVHAYV